MILRLSLVSLGTCRKSNLMQAALVRVVIAFLSTVWRTPAHAGEFDAPHHPTRIIASREGSPTRSTSPMGSRIAWAGSRVRIRWGARGDL